MYKESETCKKNTIAKAQIYKGKMGFDRLFYKIMDIEVQNVERWDGNEYRDYNWDHYWPHERDMCLNFLQGEEVTELDVNCKVL